MRLLVAVSTCYDFEKNGNNDVIRECWLKDCAAVGIDYKMFVGTGQGAENAELPADMILLPEVDDGYGDLSKKTQHSLRWAAERHYSHVFRCFPDTYARPERLIDCGFEYHDFHGDFRGEHCNPDNYGSGGPGYFLSWKAFTPLLEAPIKGVHRVSDYAEDLWVGQILTGHYERLGLKYHDDNRFINRGTNHDGPLATNDIISTHLSCPDRYHPGRMKEKHQAWLNSVKASGLTAGNADSRQGISAGIRTAIPT